MSHLLSSSRHPARGGRFFPGQHGCWPGARGPVPALLLGLSLPRDARSCLPVSSPPRTPSSHHVPVKPEHTVPHPVLQSRAAALDTMPLQTAALCIHSRDLEQRCCLLSCGSPEALILSLGWRLFSFHNFHIFLHRPAVPPHSLTFPDSLIVV